MTDCHSQSTVSFSVGTLASICWVLLCLQEIKDQLTQRGAEEAVFDLQNRKPGPKKMDWVQLLRAMPVA